MTADTQDAVENKYGLSDEQEARLAEIERRGLADLKRFSEHYPASVIRHLHENMMEWLHDRLKAAGMTLEAEVISTHLCIFERYLELCPNGTYDAEHARSNRLVDSGLPIEMSESIGVALRLMAEDGKLDAWI